VPVQTAVRERASRTYPAARGRTMPQSPSINRVANYRGGFPSFAQCSWNPCRSARSLAISSSGSKSSPVSVPGRRS